MTTGQKCSESRGPDAPTAAHCNATAVGTSTRLRLAVAAAVVALAGVAVVAAPSRPADPASIPARGSVTEAGLVYSFDALTARETLIDPATDRDVSAEHVRELPRYRAKLVRELGVQSLDQMVEAHRAAADELRRLGYL